jgi:hypothetical protein
LERRKIGTCIISSKLCCTDRSTKWTEIDRLLKLDGDSHDHHQHHHSHGPAVSPGGIGNGSGWPDVWRIYEDVCVLCAGLWLGTWRRNSLASYATLDGADAHRAQWGAARAPGDVDLSFPGGSTVRGIGAGIEGRPSMSSSGPGIEYRASPNKASRRRRRRRREISGTSTLVEPDHVSDREDDDGSEEGSDPDDGKAALERRASQVRLTRALLQTFHAHTRFTLDTLAGFLPTDRAGRYTDASNGIAAATSEGDDVVLLSPKDVLAFELGPLSSLDARFVEWLGDEYGGGVRLAVRRGWRDLFGLVFGLG